VVVVLGVELVLPRLIEGGCLSVKVEDEDKV
jgi:hypothetical protein